MYHFHRLSCQQLSSQTIMSMYLQRWRRLHQTWVLKKYKQTHRMCSLLVKLFVNWQLFTSIIRYRTKSRLIFSIQIFCSQEKPQSHLEQSEVSAKPRAASIRTTRSSKAGNNNEAHSVPPAAYFSSQQLQEKAANRRRQNAKKTGGEIFVLYLLWMFLFQLSKCS